MPRPFEASAAVFAFDTVSDRDVSSMASPESATQPQGEDFSDGRNLHRYV